MKRRRLLVGALPTVLAFTGCFKVDDTSEPTDSFTSERSTDLQMTGSDNEYENTFSNNSSFTERSGDTPLETKTFTRTYRQIVRSEGLKTEWEMTVQGETVVVTYSATSSTHKQRMKLFADAFIELTFRSGGTNRDMRFVVRRSGDVWYEWGMTDAETRSYLQGEVTREKLLEPAPAETESSSQPGSREYAVHVRYGGHWRVTISTQHTVWPVKGFGTETIDIQNDDTYVITAAARKRDDGSGSLTVQILEDTTVRKEKSTGTEQKSVSVTYYP